MNSRMLTSFAVALLVSAALWAQIPTPAPVLIPESAAPAEVSQALRARVAEFLNYHIGTVNRRSIELVADESKDAYYSSGKQPFKAFTITSIEYFSKDFNRAVVKTDILRDMHIEGQSFEGTSPMATNWKIENGKWVWFLDLERIWINPVSSLAENPVRTIGEVFLEKGQVAGDFNTKESIAKEADKILDRAKLDKSEVSFTIGKAGQDRVILQNGYTGYVDLVLPSAADVPGLKVSLEKSALKPRENGVILFQYDPPAGTTPEPTEVTVRLRVDPFVQYFPIKVTLRAVAK
jgi:hypothetical protein